MTVTDGVATCCAVGGRPDAASIDTALRAGESFGSICKRHEGLPKGVRLGGVPRSEPPLVIEPEPTGPDRPRGARVAPLEELAGDALAGVIYFIQEGHDGPIKIGRTAGKATERRKDMQVGNSRTIRVLALIPGFSATERRLHTRFAAYSAGGEWFHPAAELLAFIRQIQRVTDAWRGAS